MLVLERKDGQRLLLETADGLIEISVHCTQRGRVKLGIDAPDAVTILREELVGNPDLKAESESET